MTSMQRWVRLILTMTTLFSLTLQAGSAVSQEATTTDPLADLLDAHPAAAKRMAEIRSVLLGRVRQARVDSALVASENDSLRNQLWLRDHLTTPEPGALDNFEVGFLAGIVAAGLAAYMAASLAD